MLNKSGNGEHHSINNQKKYIIKTFNSFTLEYGDNYRYNTMKNVLLNIKENEANGKDPIEFLWEQYYTNELSAADIYDRYAHYGNYNNNSKDTFEKFFSQRLNWILRDSSKPTDKTRRKITHKTSQNMVEVKIENEHQVEHVTNILQRLSKNKEKFEINLEIFNKLKSNNDKIKYILDRKGYILEDNFEETIVKLKTKYGVKKTSKAIKNILNIEGFEGIPANQGRISEIK